MMKIAVPLKKLSKDTQAIANLFRVVRPDGRVLVEVRYANNPTAADAVFDAQGNRCDANTPMPFARPR